MRKTEIDSLLYEIDTLEKEIIYLKSKPYLSEREFQKLQMDKEKLRNTRRILYGNLKR